MSIRWLSTVLALLPTFLHAQDPKAAAIAEPPTMVKVLEVSDDTVTLGVIQQVMLPMQEKRVVEKDGQKQEYTVTKMVAQSLLIPSKVPANSVRLTTKSGQVVEMASAKGKFVVRCNTTTGIDPIYHQLYAQDALILVPTGLAAGTPDAPQQAAPQPGAPQPAVPAPLVGSGLTADGVTVRPGGAKMPEIRVPGDPSVGNKVAGGFPDELAKKEDTVKDGPPETEIKAQLEKKMWAPNPQGDAKHTYEYHSLKVAESRAGDSKTDGTPASVKTIVYPVKVHVTIVKKFDDGTVKKEDKKQSFVFFKDEFQEWTFRFKTND